MPRIHMIVKTLLITVKSIRSTDIEKSCIQFPLSDKPGLSIVELDETVSLFPFPVNIFPKFNNLVGMYGNNKVISNKNHKLYCHLDDNGFLKTFLMSMITMTMIEDMAKLTVRWRTDIFFISLTATVYTYSIIILTLEAVLFHGKKHKKEGLHMLF